MKIPEILTVWRARCVRAAVATLVVAFAGEAAVAQPVGWNPSPSASLAADRVTERAMRSHIRYLADDLLEGRGPGSRGDELTQLYLRTQLERMGLQPGGEDGGWFQSVPMVGVSTSPPSSATFTAGTQKITLNHHDDMMLVSGEATDGLVEMSGELVFVGYGIQAPEYEWDDYKGEDMTGKILVMMNNDPEDDPNLFAGRKRLYYGRWDYKYAMAAKVGAAGALIIHTEPSAGYPYQVVQTSWAGEEFELADQAGPRTRVNGWVTESAAEKLVKLGGHDLEQLIASAQSRQFSPVSLGISTTIQVRATARRKETRNVLGVMPGSDPELRKQFVVFTAHHDHIGMAERDETGDYIYNGAIDNASGTAMLLAIAEALSGMEEPPRRSILFAFVGAEEQGLLGSEYLAAHPPMPAGRMAAVLNIDGINFLGKTHDLSIVGSGKSDLDDIVTRIANWQKRTVVPDYYPDRGYYYRSDQFSLAKVGVPGIYLDSGLNYVGRPDGWGKEKIDEWVKKVYHQRSDEYSDDWNLEGALQDAQLMLHAGLEIANQDAMPAWIPGDEFEAARKAALSALE